MPDARAYPERPFLAVSAAIVHDRKVLAVRRARPPLSDHFSLPGGMVECGETLLEALMRETKEETGLQIAPVSLAGYREVIIRDAAGKVERHFVILPFACRLAGGELRLNDELSEARWLDPAELANLPTTPGLVGIVETAFERLRQAG